MMKKLPVVLILALVFASCSGKKKPYFNMPWGYFETKESSKKQEIKKKSDKNLQKSKGVAMKNSKPSKPKVIQAKAKPKNKLVSKKPIAKNLYKKPAKSHIVKNNSKSVKDEKTIIIAARNAGSESYRIAGKICQHINRNKSSDIRCVVEPTPSIKYAILNQKNYDFIVSKTSIDAFYLNNQNLKSVFSLYPETLTLLASKKSKISKVSDLKGKTVFMASPGLELKTAFSRLLNLNGLSQKNVKFVQGFQMGEAFCEGKIDAIFVDINHPNPDIDEFIDVCGAKIVEMDEADVDTLVSKYDEYIEANVEKGTYPNHKDMIYSFGIMANLISTSKPSDEIVYQVTKIIFDDLQNFKISDRSLLDLTKQEMVIQKKGLIFNIHPGAMKYYREIGLKK